MMRRLIIASIPLRVVASTSKGPSRRALATGLEGYNAAQVSMMEEMCILVDADDNVLGGDTKKNVHLMDGPCMVAGGPPHRAFSVFLFNQKNELLMQKRSVEKILFPLHWANTCCSHPLHDGATFLGTEITGEMDGGAGCVRAARRKLEQELGIAPEQLPTDCFQVVTRVHYKAPMPGPSPRWGEHEVDYLLVARPEHDVTVAPNPEEVAEARWMSQQQIRQLVADAAAGADELISPWFGEIEGLLLHTWWEDLARIESDSAIHRCYMSDTHAR